MPLLPPRSGLRGWLRRRRLPPPGEAAVPELGEWLEVGRPGERALALSRLAVAGPGAGEGSRSLSALALAALDAPAPIERRAAAWVLGWLGAAADRSAGPDREAVLARLWPRLRGERCDAVRLTMALASVRCGARPDSAWDVLEAAARRRMATFYGPRSTARFATAGVEEVGRLWRRALDPIDAPDDPDASRHPRPMAEIRAWALEGLEADPEDRERLRALALQQHPDDHGRVTGRKWTSGRRESHWICEAMGLHGDARAVPDLVRVLRAMDVDPGHGFAGRKAAALALGRIGDPSVGPVLRQALRDEAADHEGRPGAGLGIQFPVRSVVVAALGEAGCIDEAGAVVPYLLDDSGSALGGFYLPAMDALWKLGRPDVLEGALDGSALAAANAVGVLGALGYRERVEACRRDPRTEVASTAAMALELLGGEALEPQD